MTRRKLCWLALASVTAMLTGCDSGGLKEGMPSNTDTSKIPDPMAGVKLNEIGKKTKKGK